MTHPTKATREALVNKLTATINNVDVLNMEPIGFASSAYIRIGDMRAEITREAFAMGKRLQLGEFWDIDLTIGVVQARDDRETMEIILEIADDILDYLTENPTLAGAKDLAYCRPTDVVVEHEDGTVVGKMTLNCRYRVSRSSS